MTINMSRVTKSARVPGTLLERRGGWIRPADGSGALVGVWAESIDRTIVLHDGSVKRFHIPAGICVHGTCPVRSAK